MVLIYFLLFCRIYFFSLTKSLIFFSKENFSLCLCSPIVCKIGFYLFINFLFAVHACRAIKCRVRPVGCELKTRMIREWKQKSLVNLKNISTGTGRRSRLFHEAWKAITSGETFNATAAWIYEWSAMFSPAASARLEAAMFSNAKASNHKFSRQVLDPNYHFCTI